MRLNDRYELGEQIAVGGMGTVYRGHDERLNRAVAIKVLKEHLSTDDRFVERFRREARAVASLTHPNIASLYDYGEDEGRHFIVMELIDGDDLATALQTQGALEPERARMICRQICDALAVAHAAGIVHRDVKPGNVLLTSDGTAKVTDFGIARAEGDSNLTMTGSILGTAHYLAPEQAAGEPATPATDVYATGVVLFEMLTGAVPFTADSPVAVATKHMNDEVPAPSSMVPSVPADLDSVVLKATAKDPDTRFADAAAMAAALHVAGATTPAVAATEELPAPSATTAVLPALGASDPKLKRIALWTTAGLIAAVLALLAFRLLEDPERTAANRNEREGAGAGAGSTPTRTASPKVPDVVNVQVPDVRGVTVAEAIPILLGEDLVPSVEESQETSVVLGTQPEHGSEVVPGTTVTLVLEEDVAEEDPEDKSDKEEEDEEPDEGDEDDDEEGPPAHSNGKAKGKEKKDK